MPCSPLPLPSTTLSRKWDIKTYFVLGGAMHDAAIAAWGIKGRYDYIRPISAVRGMAERGQSSDPALPSWSADGIPPADDIPGRLIGARVGRDAFRMARSLFRGARKGADAASGREPARDG